VKQQAGPRLVAVLIAELAQMRRIREAGTRGRRDLDGQQATVRFDINGSGDRRAR